MLLVETAAVDWSDDEGSPPLALALDDPAVALEAVTVAAAALRPAALLDDVRRLDSLDTRDEDDELSAAVESIRRAGAGGRRPCCDPPLGARTVEGRDDVVLI
jgi:hypothetical protein